MNRAKAIEKYGPDIVEYAEAMYDADFEDNNTIALWTRGTIEQQNHYIVKAQQLFLDTGFENG